MMRRPEPADECKGSGNERPRHYSGDGWGALGTCGLCGSSVEFVSVKGRLVPKSHRPQVRPRSKGVSAPQLRMTRRRTSR